MKILLYSDHKWTEDSFPFLIKHINRAKGVTIDSIDRRPAPKKIPQFQNSKNNCYLYPDWEWFYQTLTEPVEDEYAFVIWHEGRRDGMRLQESAKRRYNGVYDSVTTDTAFNAVVFADEHRAAPRHQDKYEDMSDFERIFLHEVSHGMSRYKGTDLTHYHDYERGDIPSAFATYDLSGFSINRRIIHLLQNFLDGTQLETWHPPLDDMDTISQPYGVRNSRYPRTGRHIGVDLAVPEGTRIYAPKDCTITKTGSHSVLGNWLEIETTFRGERVWTRHLHLLYRPKKGTYKRGEVIALTGNTGDSDGPHDHWDIRRDSIRKATPNNWDRTFINPLDTL